MITQRTTTVGASMLGRCSVIGREMDLSKRRIIGWQDTVAKGSATTAAEGVSLWISVA